MRTHVQRKTKTTARNGHHHVTQNDRVYLGFYELLFTYIKWRLISKKITIKILRILDFSLANWLISMQVFYLSNIGYKYPSQALTHSPLGLNL